MESNSVALAALTLSGTIAAGFFTLVNKQNRTHEKIATALDKVAASNIIIAEKTEKVAQATVQGNKEAKERNGHLAELVIQTNDKAIEAIQSVKKQEVGEQHVKVQSIDEVKT